MDTRELFSDFEVGDQASTGAGCRAPVGRRRVPRPQPAPRRYRAPSPTLRLLADIRRQQRDSFTDLVRGLDEVAAEVGRNTTVIATVIETLDQLRCRLVALERDAGLVEQPQAPRASRRNLCP
jgi:hypothetical protein